MCAMSNGKSIATTMGFTAIDGLPMGTRCGNPDPGVILYLMQVHRMDASMIESLLYKESGLLVSGILTARYSEPSQLWNIVSFGRLLSARASITST